MDTESNNLLRTFEFGKSVPSVLINKDGDMIILTGNSASDYELTLYNLQTLEVIQEDQFSINRYFFAGSVQSENRLSQADPAFDEYFFQPGQDHG